MSQINIQFTRLSAFYSPLITTIAGGFLDEKGLTPVHSVCPPGESAIDALVQGRAHVVQSALSQGPSAYEVTLDVFEHVGRLKTRYPYDEVCTQPPSDE